ncbi:hypothetical protein Tco_0381645 [Tanacetum coccineum]
MLVQPTQEEGASSERLSEAQPSPSPAPTSEAPNESLPDSSSAQHSEVSDQAKEIKLLKAKISKLKKKATPQLEKVRREARKVQEEWEAEEEKNKIAKEEAANEALIKNFDDVKARIEADKILAEKLQEQEREQFSIEERRLNSIHATMLLE